MKKLLFFLFTLVVLASGCGKKNTFTLEGSIKGLPSDTILVFYQEPDYKLDTILLSKGKFTYTITPDTFTIFSLLLGEKQILPIYADKGESVTLNGMAGKIEVKGKGENAQLAKHIQYLSTLENNKAAVMTAVDSLIKTNPSSYSNIYLIDKYYVQDSLPDYNHIDQLIKGLSGIIKDTPYIIELQNKLSEKKELTEHRYVSNISCTDKKGKTVNWNSVKGKYVLLDFWASWNKESIATQDSLVSVQKALKKDKFVIISLSLDLRMLVKVYGAAVQGIDATIVTIEVNSSRGIKFFLVGLPDSAVKESHERIISALQVNGYKFPTCQIVVNMAPADIRKEGSAYDLPLAIGILAATQIVSEEKLSRYLIIGELSLDGSLQPVKGALSIAISAREQGFEGFILPKQNAREAAVVNNLKVYGVENIKEVIEFFNNERNLEPSIVNTREEFYEHQSSFPYDFADVKGQESVKRALEVAASGGHNLIMIGSPGSGKSMMAKCMPSILPPLSLGESLETTKIHSVAGKLGKDSSLIAIRPFRSPHHTISQVAMVGGGTNPQPGEISLAHNGLLFLDELPEFNRSVLEVLRQPLEDRHISIARAKYSLDYPASFMLVASMNPCPCGYYNHPTRACVCNPGQVQRYLNRISGPLLDRIDIQIEIVPVPFEKMAERHHAESSASIRERVIKAREIQAQRFANHPGIYCNAQMEAGLLHLYAQPNEAGLKLLRTAMTRLNLSARAYGRILKVARTIADLDNSEHITSIHLAEAISYRNLDREDWAG